MRRVLRESVVVDKFLSGGIRKRSWVGRRRMVGLKTFDMGEKEEGENGSSSGQP